MIDVEHDDLALRLVDFVHDPIRADPDCVQPGEVAPQRTANAVGIVKQPPKDEFEHGCGDLVGQSVETPVGWAGHLQYPWTVPQEARRRRSSSNIRS